MNWYYNFNFFFYINRVISESYDDFNIIDV